jgi:3-deoxy-D-manno-octulosonate 8-phosphate phosphatase KdsC-like HAD superfamily phosphatase
MLNFKQRLPAVKAVLFDIDGVLTDGSLQMHGDGAVSRTFHARDGFALQQAVKSDLIVGIVSAAREEILKAYHVENIFKDSNNVYYLVDKVDEAKII